MTVQAQILNGMSGLDTRDTLNDVLTGGASKRKLSLVSLRDLGCVPGQDIAPTLNTAIASADPGTIFVIPGINGGSAAEKWLVGSSITVNRSNIGFRGVGSRGNAGSVLTRTGGTFPLMLLEGTSGGTSADGMIGEIGLDRVCLHGNDSGGHLIRARFLFHLGVDRCAFRSPGQAAAFFSDQQTQDYDFLNSFFEGGGTSDGSIGVIHLDDSAGTNAGHSQNGRWVGCDFESYNGTWLKMLGKGTGPGNSLFRFLDIKSEAPNRSNVPDIDIEQVYRSKIDMRQIVSKGTSGQTKAAMVKMTNCEAIDFNALLLHQAGGATLTRLIDRSGSSNCTTVLRTAGAAMIDALTADHLILDTVTDRNFATSDNFGTAPTQKRLTSIQQVVASRGVSNEIYTIDAVYQRVRRTDAAGVVQAAVRVQEIINPTTTRYFGFDGNNNVAGGDVLNIGGAPRWILDNSPTGLSTFVNGLRFGTVTTGPALLSGAGSPEGTVSAPVGSLYSNTTASAAAGSRFFYKGSGTGNTGWIGY